MERGASVTLPVEQDFEYGVLAVDEQVQVDGGVVDARRMAYAGTGRSTLTLAAPSGGIVLLLGGVPFDEQLVMWWNFIGRSHEEIVEQRAAWNGRGLDDVPERFGQVLGFDGDRLLAPPMPNSRLKPR
jgi:redox-sensitive bicupin YhaK (pirin superfamily)